MRVGEDILKIYDVGFLILVTVVFNVIIVEPA